MYVGHLALALGTRRVAPEVPLVVLLVSTVLADLVDALLGLVGFEDVVGVATHTLPAAAGWAVGAFGVAAFRWGARSGLLIAALTLSHVLGDGVTSHLLAWPGGPRWGLGLYEWRAADFAFEVLVILGCWAMYQRGLPRRVPVLTMLGVLLGLQAFFDFGLSLH